MNVIILAAISLSIFSESATTDGSTRFEVVYEWKYINFTWPNENIYKEAITSKKYVPQNNAMAGIKFYKDNFYIAMPRICSGTPVTLGYIKKEETLKSEVLINPFPDWESNDLSDHTCNKLENVQSMEIDSNGVMWVIDGFRLKDDSKCPPKLILYDLNDNNKILLNYSFDDVVSLNKGGFLNDLVIDDADGGFAYITDNSPVDPGLVVFSRKEKRSWKFRDASMFAEVSVSNFVVDGVGLEFPAPIDGIALSAKSSGQRNVYYTTLSGLNLYSISTEILKKEKNAKKGMWRKNVTLIGAKPSQSDGMIVDSENNLYYGLLPLYGVGKWNTLESFSTAEILDTNNVTMNWNDSFCFDDSGFLYLLANQINKFFNSDCSFEVAKDPVFRIMKYFANMTSYLGVAGN